MKTLFLSLLIVFTVTVTAQKGFHIGASGTFNSAWILNQNNYGTLGPFQLGVVRSSEMNYKLTWGGNAGIVLGYNFKKNWGIQTEIQYNITGQKYEDNFEGPATIPEGTFTGRVNVKRDIRLSYLQIPLLAKFICSKGRTAKFFMCLGPQVGVRLTAREEVRIANYIYLPDSLDYNPKQKFQTIDVGIALQLGTEIYVTDHLYFDVGLSVYGGLYDINGNALRNLDWYSKNDVNYQKSYNFRGGLMVGLHYIIGEGREDY
jgi:hypothetical protein